MSVTLRCCMEVRMLPRAVRAFNASHIGVGYHFGLRRQDIALLFRLEAAIRELCSSGELAEIKKRWETKAVK